MKKITAFFLLLIFSINWIGYRFIFDYVQHKTNSQFEIMLDKELYDDAQLVELKIALNVPYQSNRSVYERIDGEVNVEGVLYKYVKRKVANDTLYLMCLPDIHKMQLEIARNDVFTKWNIPDNNNAAGKSKKGCSLLKQLQDIYNESFLVIRLISPSINTDRNWASKNSGLLHTILHLSPEQPPDC